MDNKEQNNEVTIELEEDLNINNLSIQEQIYEIEIRMQELDSQIEQLEDILYETRSEDFPHEEYENLKMEYKSLRKQKKDLVRNTKGTWDKIPVWMFAYGVFQVILSFFYILSMVSLMFASWFLGLIHNKMEITRFWEIVAFFFVPFISIVISLVILCLIKDKARKKFFAVVFSIQTLETIISVILMISYLSEVWKK